MRLPVPAGSQVPPRALRSPGRPGRRRRRIWLTAGILLALLALLVGLDRLAAAYAANQVATRIQGYGFPVKPGVTIEGFPFLTQVISRHFDGVDISAPNFPAGPVTANIQVRATGISVDPGYHSGSVARIAGTGLITFASIASLASAAGAPGLTLTRAGPHRVRLTANLQGVSASAIARVRKTGRNAFGIRIVSANGIPPSVLGSVQHLTIRIPKLPLGITVQTASVTGQGVLLTVTGANIHFGS